MQNCEDGSQDEKVIREYTKGDYKEIPNCPDAEYNDGTYGDAFCFSTIR